MTHALETPFSPAKCLSSILLAYKFTNTQLLLLNISSCKFLSGRFLIAIKIIVSIVHSLTFEKYFSFRGNQIKTHF